MYFHFFLFCQNRQVDTFLERVLQQVGALFELKRNEWHNWIVIVFAASVVDVDQQTEWVHKKISSSSFTCY